MPIIEGVRAPVKIENPMKLSSRDIRQDVKGLFVNLFTIQKPTLQQIANGSLFPSNTLLWPKDPTTTSSLAANGSVITTNLTPIYDGNGFNDYASVKIIGDEGAKVYTLNRKNDGSIEIGFHSEMGRASGKKQMIREKECQIMSRN